MQNLQINGVANFRELGGIKTKDGKKIKHGYFYRSGQLGEIKEKSKDKFDKLGIKNIVDYRDIEEKQRCEDYVGNATYHFLPAIQDTKGIPMQPDAVRKMLLTVSEEDAIGAAETFSEIYGELPFGNQAYAKTMQLINEFEPILIHCTAGKDRTGVGSALILKALGVSTDEIIKDFMLSNHYRKFENYKLLVLMFLFKRNKWARYLYKKVSFVHEYNILRTLGEIKKKYPNFNEYLEKECGITAEQVAKWRAFYLE